jgi:hypothetical protein
MKIFISRNKSGAMLPLDHVVAVIPKDTPLPNYKYNFRNKDAVIIDPWLNVTEFAGKYSELLKNDYANLFGMLPDNEYNMILCAKTSKNVNEFKNNWKDKVFSPDIKFLLHEDGFVTGSDAKQLKEEYPGLVIKNFNVII